MDFTLFENRYLLALASAVIGVLLTLVTQRILNKRGLFTYFVRHSRVGISADDAVFGSVRVTWNNNPVANLYSSTVELRNESLKDYDDVVVRVFSNDTMLLTERAELLDTTRILEWTEEFSSRLAVAPGTVASEEQLKLYFGQRDYLLPTMNRGQKVRLSFLNTAKTEKQPTIWLDILHKGVKVKFRVAHNEVLGVPQPHAGLMGAMLGFLLIGLIVVFVNTVWLAALIALIYGFFAQVPGAFVIKCWRWLREWLGD
jgi:hypothetical protein